MIKKILVGMVGLAFLASCSKSSSDDQSDAASLKAKVAEVNNLILPPPDDEGDGAKYVEKACVTGNQAGTLCESAKGTCKKERSCTAVRVATTMTAQQIETAANEYAAQMVREGYIDEKNIESSKGLYIALATRIQKK